MREMRNTHEAQEVHEMDEMQGRIREVLRLGTLAPSGDNSQPWRFVMRGAEVDLFNVPSRDTSLYNHRQRASLLGHGALVENVTIAGRALGLGVSVELFPDTGQPDWVCRFAFTPSKPVEDPLFSAIPARITHRGPYTGTPLTPAQAESLKVAGAAVPGAVLHLVTGSEERAALAHLLRWNERVVFENPNLHRFLFDHVRWTREEEERTGDGIPIDTLGLNPPQRLGFPALSRWGVVRALNHVGLSAVVALESLRKLRASSALGLVSAGGGEDRDFVVAGRAMERVWLEATRLGLAFQPVTGIICLMERVAAGELDGIPAGHVERLRELRPAVSEAFGLGNRTPAMAFRLGPPVKPGRLSARFPLERVVDVS
ncbi:MAG: nitroreductase [Gammaproteobacteria bacterium]|nr:nitroreductase [Gammaproteobacteria bacterium]